MTDASARLPSPRLEPLLYEAWGAYCAYLEFQEEHDEDAATLTAPEFLWRWLESHGVRAGIPEGAPDGAHDCAYKHEARKATEDYIKASRERFAAQDELGALQAAARDVLRYFDDEVSSIPASQRHIVVRERLDVMRAALYAGRLSLSPSQGAPPPQGSAPDVTRWAETLREFIRDQRPGGCKVVSLGMACECPLCCVDNLVQTARGLRPQGEAPLDHL